MNLSSQKQKKVTWTFPPCWRDRAKTFSVELLAVVTDIWSEYIVVLILRSKGITYQVPGMKYRFPKNYEECQHPSEYNSRAKNVSPPMCSPCPCGHSGMFSIEKFDVFCIWSREGEVLCFLLEPARTSRNARWCCGVWKSVPTIQECGDDSRTSRALGFIGFSVGLVFYRK